MRIVIFLLLFASAPGFICAQSKSEIVIDSLESVLKNARHEKARAAALAELSNYYRVAGEPARALEAGEAALDIAKRLGNKSLQASSLNNIGMVYDFQGDMSRALDYYLNSLKAYRTIDSDLAREAAATLYVNIGTIYGMRGDLKQALAYNQKALAIQEKTNNLKGQSASLANIGVVYSLQGEQERAHKIYRKSLEISRAIGDSLGVGNMLGNISETYWSRGEYEQAEELIRQSRAAYEAVGSKRGVAHTLANASLMKLEAGYPRQARVAADSALKMARELNNLYEMEQAAQYLSRADSALGDWKSAYEHFKLYKQYGDSLNNEAQSQEIGRLEAQYEFDKEIEERERLEAEAAARRATLIWIAAGVFAALLLVAGLLVWGFRTKQKANKLLSAQNAEIIQQSEEISQQRDELQAMNEQITEQRDVLEKAHEEITDSIDYASRIQLALLPAAETMKRGAEVYVYYKARDVVSGDFYWTHQIDADTFIYAAVDCTGHGVPGAFMSVLGAATLDTIVREYGETRPDRMLGLLDQGVRASLKQDENEAKNKDGSLDGMDLALVKLDRKSRKLEFSSAGRPLFLLRNGEILEYKGAKFPAGGAQHGEKTFPLVEINLEPRDRVFVFSDGITDQFGGPRGRKFSPRRLKETLLAYQDKDLQAQGAAFAEVFDEWQSAAKQLDDQLLIGLEA